MWHASLALHLPAPLRAVMGASPTAWAGPFAAIAMLELGLHPAPPSCAPDGVTGCSTAARALSTSTSCHARGFQSVLRTHAPKALMFNRDNFKAWKGSGFDARVAERLLEATYLERSRKRRGAEERAAQGALASMLLRCTTVHDVHAVVSEAHAHMSPDNVVLAISRLAKLPLGTHGDPLLAPGLGVALVPGLQSTLLPLLEPHLPALTTRQLAELLGALARGGCRPPPTSALAAQLDGDAGRERADAAGPRETAELMAACARLRWGSPAVWDTLGEAALAQLSDMEPESVAAVLHAVAASPAAAAAQRCSHLWALAEDTLLQADPANDRGQTRLAGFPAPTLARVLLSFALSGTAEGRKLRERAAGALTSRNARVPPAAAVDVVQACSVLMARGGADDEPAVRSLMQHGLQAVALGITHLSTRAIERALAAADAAYGAVPVRPRSMQDLMGLAADVLAVRGLHSENPGALPTPAAAPAPGNDAGAAAVGALLLLCRLGFFSGLHSGSARSLRLLDGLLASAERLQAMRALTARQAGRLLQGFVSAAGEASVPHEGRGVAAAGGRQQHELAEASARSHAARMAVIVAPALSAGAAALPPAAAASALTALLDAAAFAAPLANGAQPQQAVEGAALIAGATSALADRLAGAKLGALPTDDLRELRRAVGAAPSLSGHPLVRLLSSSKGSRSVAV